MAHKLPSPSESVYINPLTKHSVLCHAGASGIEWLLLEATEDGQSYKVVVEDADFDQVMSWVGMLRERKVVRVQTICFVINE